MADRISVGTSGWAYAGWKPGFYPKEVPAKDFLKYYASQLNSVEVNFTFRQRLTAKVADNWLASTPSEFYFTFKAHQAITHYRRLKDVDELVKGFFESLEGFLRAGKLGAVMFQVPHNLKVDLTLFEAFLDRLPRAARNVIEFRHASWLNEEVYAAMRQRNVGFCVTEGTDELTTPDIATADFRYYRLRRGDYKPEEIAAMAAKLRAATEKTAFVYYKHEETPEGALCGRELLQRLRP